ncbi:MAG: hypothetical protein MJ081_08820 [Ruminococcus sp.]|nr:hypothetical protein [Ruminococcus sp.]
MKEKKTMQEMNEQFKDAPNKTKTYEIDGVKYTVHSHFVGKKKLNDIMLKIALEEALNPLKISA